MFLKNPSVVETVQKTSNNDVQTSTTDVQCLQSSAVEEVSEAGPSWTQAPVDQLDLLSEKCHSAPFSLSCLVAPRQEAGVRSGLGGLRRWLGFCGVGPALPPAESQQG